MPILKLTSAQSEALAAREIVQAPEFVLMRPSAFRELLGFSSEEELRQELQSAWDESDRGELVEWDVNEFLARMHGSRGAQP